MEKAKITVKRLPVDLLGGQYLITLTLDGTKIARLRPGASVSREIEPGRHRLQAYNTLVWKTVEFDVEAGDGAEFVTANRVNVWSEIAAFIGFGLFGVTLEPVASS
jgi:hypothetical protein